MEGVEYKVLLMDSIATDWRRLRELLLCLAKTREIAVGLRTTERKGKRALSLIIINMRFTGRQLRGELMEYVVRIRDPCDV